MLLSDIGITYNWSVAELNAFCMVCESKNLSQVAVRLDVSQSAVSLMVQRWREAVGDPLFVRTRHGVAPTDTALALRQKILPLLEGLKLALSQPLGFDPGKSERVFRVHMSDIGQLVFLPDLCDLLAQQAPGARLQIRNLPWEGVETALSAGEVDLAIGSLPMIRGRVHTRVLRREPYVTLMRSQHHLAQRKLDLKAFADAEHLVIDSSSSGHALVDSILRSKGIHRRVGLAMPHYLAVEALLARSDYLLTMPAVAVRSFRAPEAFHIVPTPLPLPTFDIRVHWHERSREDEGVRWLRNAMIDHLGQGAAAA
ncbi:LysR family transcriptional regulator [Jeongeupia naejangsanensis]|uniref:LysR family transcriptional regulator n=1 Tax=Jeongeupia naejangsanensis TaxID=613195 RepID=A0ABS2BQK8_9NEIS|nr:LysR family transcriptional regulator [Jeongeupia naejangsanensis]MBM3117911.1 LysR family transcriptional regulator [Jeongeupia naejangsanensis]